jgi:hypothetical protein
VLLSLCSAASTSAQSASADAVEQESQVAFAGFNQALERYLSLRQRLQIEVPPPRVTSDVAEIQGRLNALALALQRARPKARQGDFFDAASTGAIKQRFAAVLSGVPISQLYEAISDDPADNRSPRVHMRYPVSGAMARMPANLLAVLPQLPADLEYRLVGRALILREVNAAMILDYVADALPRN